MKKIETIFNRDNNFKVIPQFRSGCEWVQAGEGVLTEKLDGTNIRLTVKSGQIAHVEKRRNPTRQEKSEGVEPGYIDAYRNDPQDKHIFKAVDGTSTSDWPDGIYEAEAVGPKIQGNPLELKQPTCYPFKFRPVVLPDCQRTFMGIKEYVLNLESQFSPSHLAEGIVFHHSDGRMAKIKRKDFDIIP